MMYLGMLLAVLAVVAAVVGWLQRGKMKTILATPFRPTAQALAGADGSGTVSFQGMAQPHQPLYAPCSGQPCLYYEVKITQEWEKQVQTENGYKKQSGSDSAHEAKQGSMFWVNDGSGAVAVNATESVDAKLETSFDHKHGYGWGDVTFGGYRAYVSAPSDHSKHATATRCVEKILPANGELFVLGKVENNTVTKRDGLLGSLMLAREGRESLLGATKRNMTIAFAAAGLLLPVGTAMAVFGESPAMAADSCASMEDDIAEPCTGRMHDADDVTYLWDVTEGGEYTFSAIGTGNDPNMRLWPKVEVRDDSDEAVLSMAAHDGDRVEQTAHFKPGTYTIIINDAHAGWAKNLDGGAGFELEIDSVEGTANPASENAAKDSPVKAFFTGPIPEGVKLTKGYTAYDPRYTMTIPATWKTGGNRASGYMAMRGDSTAAVFCEWGRLTLGKAKTLAKRAPAHGTDVTIEEKAEVFKMGSKVEFTVRAGRGEGRFFKKDGGQLYWMDVAYEDSYNGSATTGAVHCVMMVKADADDVVVNEAKGIMRGFLPPQGKKIIDDRIEELVDTSKRKRP